MAPFYLRQCTSKADVSKWRRWSGRSFPRHALASKLPRHQATLLDSTRSIPTSISHPFSILRLTNSPRWRCMHHGRIVVEDDPRGLPRVGSLASTTSNDARSSSLETTCTRRTGDTRPFCLNEHLPPVVDAINPSIRIFVAEAWTRLFSIRSTESVHSRPRAAKLSRSPSTRTLRRVQAR